MSHCSHSLVLFPAEALPKNDAIPKTTVDVDVTDESIDGDTNQSAIMKDLKVCIPVLVYV